MRQLQWLIVSFYASAKAFRVPLPNVRFLVGQAIYARLTLLALSPSSVHGVLLPGPVVKQEQGAACAPMCGSKVPAPPPPLIHLPLPCSSMSSDQQVYMSSQRIHIYSKYTAPHYSMPHSVPVLPSSLNALLTSQEPND
jgi:hypothetical protein